MPTADHELSAEEIRHRFGPLLRQGVEAFKRDPWLLVDVAESATAPGVQERAQQRSALRQAFEDGLSLREAGEVVGLSAGAVHYRWAQMGLRVSDRPKPVPTASDAEERLARKRESNRRTAARRRAREKAARVAQAELLAEERAAEAQASVHRRDEERDRFDSLTRALTGLSLREASSRLECSQTKVRTSWIRQGLEYNTADASKARTAAILPLLDEGLKPAEIMARLGVTRSHVLNAQRHRRAETG